MHAFSRSEFPRISQVPRSWLVKRYKHDGSEAAETIYNGQWPVNKDGGRSSNKTGGKIDWWADDFNVSGKRALG